VKARVWTVAGSVVMAAVSSACCWLPLATLGLGLGAGGAAAALDRYRWLFLGVAAALLGVGFYLNYRRGADCAPDGTCPPRRPLLRSLNRVVLWISAALVASFAVFPEIASVTLRGGRPSAASSSLDSTIIVLQVGGMSCAACEAPVEQALASVRGVRAVRADAGSGQVKLTLDHGAAPSDSLMNVKLAAAGYRLLR
jgi:copper chaperone CopZ